MAMLRQSWSISGLSKEFQIDRRTMAKRLEGLEPAESKVVGERTENRYYLSDVLKHFNRRRNKDEIEDEMWEELKRYFGKTVFPNIVNDDSFIGTLLGAVTEDMGLSKSQAIEIYKISVFAVVCGLSHSFDDDAINFEFTGFFETAAKTDTDEFVKNHWPVWEKE